MNLALHRIEANLGPHPADTFLRDLHPDLNADYVLANPPFNVSDWSGQLVENDVRWRFGKPPNGNANYAWIQHFTWPSPTAAAGGRPGRLHRSHARPALLHHRHPCVPLVPHARQDRPSSLSLPGKGPG